ncbi:hypothetical protein LTR66_017015 [Elasticomyces elasticus]|nr:hypothetical protein LTR66_017015 [Elasticomyces elasticus]
MMLSGHDKLIENERPNEDIEDQLEDNERRSLDNDKKRQGYEMQQIEKERSTGPKRAVTDESELAEYEIQNPEITLDVDRENKGFALTRDFVKMTADVLPSLPLARGLSKRHKSSWADRNDVKNRRSAHFGRKYNQGESDGEMEGSRPGSQAHPINTIPETADQDTTGHLRPVHVRAGSSQTSSQKQTALDTLDKIKAFNPLVQNKQDLEAQRQARAELSDALYAGVNDELEDLSAEQRDALVQRAFQHSAIRARRPVIWIPRDELGVSDDEVVNIGKFGKGNIWVSNVRQGLDSKGRTVYSGAPPDFSEVDLIPL